MPLGFSAAPLPVLSVPLSVSSEAHASHPSTASFICTNRARVCVCIGACVCARVVPATRVIQRHGARSHRSQPEDIECCSQQSDCLPQGFPHRRGRKREDDSGFSEALGRGGEEINLGGNFTNVCGHPVPNHFPRN